MTLHTGSALQTLRYGIIGYGLMGAEHARNLALVAARGLGARLVAVADPERSSRERARRELGQRVQLFENTKALLHRSEVDALIVATPNHTHRAVLEELWGRPVHLLIEKPLCTTLDDCASVLGRSEHHPGLVWVGMEYRYMPPVARLIEEVRGGAVGKPVMVSIREHRFPFLPKVGDWNRFKRNSGDTLVEKCCHFFDLMVYITGDRPHRVFASGAQSVNHLGERYHGETPDILDNAFVLVEFEHGVRALLDLCMFAEASEHEQEIVVTGDRGKVECFLPQATVRLGRRDLEAADPTRLSPRGMHHHRVETIEVPVEKELLEAGHHHGATYWQHVKFLDAIRGRGEVEVTLADGGLAVAVGLAAQASIARGLPVLVDAPKVQPLEPPETDPKGDRAQ